MRTVKIPIKPHLKKFVLKTYDCENEIVKATKHNSLGIMIEMVLRLKYEIHVTSVDKYTEVLEIELNQDCSNLEVRAKRIAYVNYILEKDFKATMFLFVQAQKLQAIPALTGIKTFLKFYGIEEYEYGSDSAYRQWTRMSNDEYNRKKKRPVLLQDSQESA